MAQARVQTRVQEGGHNIPNAVIARRYILGIKNLFDLYLPIVDEALIFDNSIGKHECIAHKKTKTPIEIINPTKFNFLKQYSHEQP
jgi:predicted ABC-type ATPase